MGMMGRWTIRVAAALAIAAASPAIRAQHVISKRYVLDRRESDDAARLIAIAAPSPPDVNWPELRRKLYKSSSPTGNLRITTVAGRVAISDDSPRPTIDVIAGGEPMKWRINDGQLLDVSAKADGDAVEVRYVGDGYQRVTVYRNIGDSLLADTTIVSPMLSAAIRFKSVYR